MNTEPGWIEELLKNNDPPSDVAAQEVKGLLLKPLKELEDIDAEMLSLRERLLELESQRAETKKQMIRYQSILAPIRRVYPEILGEIFYHCLPTDRHPIMSSSDCPLLLGRVGSTWRSTAISTPRLWDRLHITFTDEDTVPDFETALEMVRNGQDLMDGWETALPKATKERTTQLLRRRYEGVKEWFLRSGTRPISISLHFTTTEWYKVPYSDRTPGAMAELLSLLASLSSRWEKFELDAPFEINQALADRLPVSQMTTLTAFTAGSVGIYHGPYTRTLRMKILDTPNLQKITVWGGYELVWRNSYRSSMQWDKITHISCATSDNKIMFLFEHASNLVEYRGVIAAGRADDTAVVYDGLISLPFLRSLSIAELISPERSGNIYDHINAPNLQYVEYSNDFSGESLSLDNPIPFPIVPLLRKSTELETLSVQGHCLRFWDVGTLMGAVPSVKYLVIGTEAKLPTPIEPMIHRDCDRSLVLCQYSWSFSDLVVDNNSDMPLLPQLKSLSITSDSVLTSDDALFDMIKSRISPSSKTASLEKVKAVLFREMERNIVEELSTYAESVGVKIRLDFKYAQKPDSSLLPTSPDFGL